MKETVQAAGLIFDLEVIPGKDSKPDVITMVGALRPDTGAELEVKIKGDLPQALEKLDALSPGATFVLGHNIINHDLPLLRKVAPKLRLHALPVIDTLRLSPLAFPQNPYHRLIKDYKLIRHSLNSPLSDCRSTLTLFSDQKQAFCHLGQQLPAEILCYQALLAPTESCELSAFFAAMTGRRTVSLDEARALIPTLLKEQDGTLGRDIKVCRTRLNQLLELDLKNAEMHWPLAYSLAWLRVSGGNSVIPPWVWHQFPAVSQLIKELRDLPCGQPECRYCATVHDPRHELRRYFAGFDDFRHEKPGKSLQHDIVLAGMRGENVLAVLATGGGKSICYQLPALNRFHRNGSLTIIISPLQSLMKDQVDGMLQRNIQCTATMNGLLSMPERADVLEKVQMGDIGILLVSPEQFRNNAFCQAIRQRQIGAWIFDEAHCLSKWGSDFRPDYLYVSRFIRNYSVDRPLAPIGCFTATAKKEVLADIADHFKAALGIYFTPFLGTHERENLHFDVFPCKQAEKPMRAHALLKAHMQEHEGGAVVFVASRKHAEKLADFLITQNWLCKHFHAGLRPHEKKDIQDDFKAGRLQVIVATNAFGMGVDKSDIRLVVHADIPGSLENYLQEAGRAGRDQQDARCVLLYDPHDIETQFGLVERSKLSLKDIQQILRKLRQESARRKGTELIITAGEILIDEEVETSFDSSDGNAETKVATAVAWLERGEYLSREQNKTLIFPAKLKIKKEEIESRLQQAKLSVRRAQEYRAILTCIAEAPPDKPINTDSLMRLTSMTHEEVGCALKQMEELGLLSNDAQLTLYVRHGVTGAATQRLVQTKILEKALFQVLHEQAPDAESGQWQDLNLSLLAAHLKEETEFNDLLPFHVQRLLRTLATGNDGENQHRSVFELKQISSDYFRLRIKEHFTWKQVEALGEKRLVTADKVLTFLISKIPSGKRAKDVLLETTMGELVGVIEGDMELRTRIPPDQRQKAIQHVLLYMHKQEIITLNQGLTVMRRAMTIQVNREKRHTYTKEDYQRLNEHYTEKCIQVHVMREYAELGLKDVAAALRLVFDYFSMPKAVFLRRYFPGRQTVLDRPTSEDSWKMITGHLSRPQQQIVVDDEDLNRLVLAGPGSGKTRVIVHRIAYLIRIRRVPTKAIVALTFNRHAANEISKRLFTMLGQEAYGVRVLTYHSMAMRLTGTRFMPGEKVDESRLRTVLEAAVEYLEGNRQAEGEDNIRDQLLRGYRYILVDEYQDIDDMQYRLVSALAGRNAGEDQRLCIMAVGDDDQNIYAWRETNNRYIQRFQEEYGAETNFLTENYRSSLHIINVCNVVIAANADRLKVDNPIERDYKREGMPAGGKWESVDPARQGKVLRLRLPENDRSNGNLQAQAAFHELNRLLVIEKGDWNGCAILARAHRYLYPIQAWCEINGIPYFLAAENRRMTVSRRREFVRFTDALKIEKETMTAEQAQAVLQFLDLELSWTVFFEEALNQLKSEAGDCHLTPGVIVDWLYDYAGQMREQSKPGLYLGTVHSAKGLEFRHVVLLDGSWDSRAENSSDERRLYYVGMTRAAETLTLGEFDCGNPFSQTVAEQTMVGECSGSYMPELERRFSQLSESEIDLSFTARHDSEHQIHQSVARLKEGDTLSCQRNGDRYEFLDRQGCVVARSTKKFAPEFQIEQCEVAAILIRSIRDIDKKYLDQHRVERWEIVVPRVVGGSF